MNIGIILAGGVGSRVGAEKPKQFLEVFGKPVIVYTIEAFQKHTEIDAIEVVCLESYRERLEEMIHTYHLSKVKWITDGGKTFQESVSRGISNLRGKISPEDIVIVHYGASPFVSEDIISDGIRVAARKGNATSATPCFLLMGSNDDGKKSSKWVDRDKLMQLNSPQCFRFGYIEDLYRRAKEEGVLETVEPHTTSLMYYFGDTIYFSKGNQTNIKITTKEDLELFKGYVLLQESYGDEKSRAEMR